MCVSKILLKKRPPPLTNIWQILLWNFVVLEKFPFVRHTCHTSVHFLAAQPSNNTHCKAKPKTCDPSKSSAQHLPNLHESSSVSALALSKISVCLTCPLKRDHDSKGSQHSSSSSPINFRCKLAPNLPSLSFFGLPRISWKCWDSQLWS